MIISLWAVFFPVAASLAVAFASFRFLHMLQLESYQGRMYSKWIDRAGQRDLYTCVLVGVIALFLRIAWLAFSHMIGDPIRSIIMYCSDAVYIAGLIGAGLILRRGQEKKKLVFTGRIMRLIIVIIALSLVFHKSFFIKLNQLSVGEILLVCTPRYLPGLLLPYFVLLCYLITLPIENTIKRLYFNDAKRKLSANPRLIKVAITGSYGKTSTKYILNTILSKKYNTFFTPGSFNTPMGITKVVRSNLCDEHEVFIAEMGARYKGDIIELCSLVAPRYGIITSVGKQHLETFGSFETVIETKSELIANLPDDGAAFINGDIEECREIYEKCALSNKFLFGLHGESLYMRAENISVTNKGSEFELITAGGERIACKTSLLGGHNILNITGAAALARYLGLTMDEIAAGIEDVSPIEHRLELIPGPITVIDDAFNANPMGAKAAMEVLSAFAPSRRIVVTPGLVELGDEQDALNEELGEVIAASCDKVILVGKQNLEPLRRGLLSRGFASESIIEAETLSEAAELLPQYASPGSVVLFENDLPDNYV